jgi:hypothetical protein
MWGVPGAILAVPLLAILKIISDRLRPLKALGHGARAIKSGNISQSILFDVFPFPPHSYSHTHNGCYRNRESSGHFRSVTVEPFARAKFDSYF